VAAFSPQVWLLIVCSVAVMLGFFKTARLLGSKHTISKAETDYIEMLPFRVPVKSFPPEDKDDEKDKKEEDNGDEDGDDEKKKFEKKRNSYSYFFFSLVHQTWTVIAALVLLEWFVAVYVLGHDTFQYHPPLNTAQDILDRGLTPIIPADILKPLKMSSIVTLNKLADIAVVPEAREEAKLGNLLVGLHGSHVLLTNLEKKDIQCRYNSFTMQLTKKNGTIEYYVGRENLPMVVDLI